MKAKYCFFDIETESLSPFKSQLHGVGIALDDADPQYFPANAVPAWVKDAVADEQIIKVGSHVRGFDEFFIGHQNWRVGGDTYDTALMSLCLDDTEREHGLKQLTARLFNDDSLSNKNELDLVLGRLKMRHVGLLCELDLQLGNGGPGKYFDLIGRYCVEDVRNSRQVFYELKKRLEAQHQSIRAISPSAPTPLLYFKNEMVGGFVFLVEKLPKR